MFCGEIHYCLPFGLPPPPYRVFLCKVKQKKNIFITNLWMYTILNNLWNIICIAIATMSIYYYSMNVENVRMKSIRHVCILYAMYVINISKIT